MLKTVAMLVLTVAVAVPALAYDVVTVPDGGALSGLVKFSGRPPALKPLPVSKDREECGDEKDAEALVLGPARGVRGSVILIEGVARGKQPRTDIVLDTHRCVFVSHVTAAMAGERARVKNSDAILHNTRGFRGAPTVFNVALPSRDQTIDITRRLTWPGVVRVVCDAHLHMSAWMIVHDSPYYAVTDARGAFRIDGIPPGRYKLTMWHEGFRPKGLDKDGRRLYDEPRTVTRDVTIAPNATATVDFDLK